MVGLPLVILALQPGGNISLKEAEAQLEKCASSKRLYNVICCQLGPRSPEGLASHTDLTLWAYQRAVLALEQYKDAVVGIGLHSTMLRFEVNRRYVMVRMAAAALVMRNDPLNPIVLSTSDNSTAAASSMVANTLAIWGKKIDDPRGKGALAERTAHRAIGLEF